VVSTTGRPVTVIARLNGEVVVEAPATEPRPDVSTVLAPALAADPRCGFSLYVDLPAPTDPPATISLEYSDGENVSKPTRYTVGAEPDLLNLDTYEGSSQRKNDLAARYLHGRGVELGALHQPLPVDPASATVEYVDRLTREQALATFPELVPHAAQFVEPTFLIDFATDDLSALEPEGFDFFIANDVIEHLPNPLKLLRDLYDAMKPGALLFLSAPDRDYTFDARRELTTNRHLWREYKRGTTEPSRAHIREYVRSTTPQVLAFKRWQRKSIYEDHRRRSIHVHVWDQTSFDAFLAWAIARLDLRLEIVERVPSRAALGCMVYVLRKLPD
jgi:SAM-dependent methyltransferase